MPQENVGGIKEKNIGQNAVIFPLSHFMPSVWPVICPMCPAGGGGGRAGQTHRLLAGSSQLRNLWSCSEFKQIQPTHQTKKTSRNKKSTAIKPVNKFLPRGEHWVVRGCWLACASKLLAGRPPGKQVVGGVCANRGLDKLVGSRNQKRQPLRPKRKWEKRKRGRETNRIVNLRGKIIILNAFNPPQPSSAKQSSCRRAR